MEKSIFTTHDIAQILGVDISTVTDWIDQKKLSAYRTPGGHRRVVKKDLLSFVKTYEMPMAKDLSTPEQVILLVEDDPNFRLAIKALIGTRPNLRIEEADDGFLAGKMANEFKPDIVILDIFLPGMDGFRVCEHIRQDRDLTDARIIALSAHDTPENRKRILAAGADVFLPKPLGLSRLPEYLDRWLSPGEIEAPVKSR